MERVLLVGANLNDGEDYLASLKELGALAEACDMEVAGVTSQTLETVHKAFYIGTGKVDEVKEMAQNYDVDVIIFDNSLSPMQMRNLQERLEKPILDRSALILDIFARRARSREAKLQVEVARLQYMLPRLVGLHAALSRQGGASGSMSSRGAGETKLELDRRVLEKRLAELRRELKEVGNERETQRKRRMKSGLPRVALVGYTNAGKSTLLNYLTDAGILAEDKLFATLDPTTRNVTLPGGQNILLTDTVGFIRKLPHHLIEAFKSTLEEARYCDIILHVVDCSNPQMDIQMHIVYETLKQLEVTDKIVVTVFNKMDKLEGEVILKDLSADYQVKMSAKTGQGADELLETLENILRNDRIYLEKVYGYGDAGKIQSIRKYGELLAEEYQEDGIFVKAYVPAELYGQLV